MRLDPDSKRDPAARMERVSETAAGDVEAAGHFRIYLGAAAGVGKTFAMLNEGRRRRDRGTDVVIGAVQTYGRPLTDAAADGLEVVPARLTSRDGVDREEMDVDAII